MRYLVCLLVSRIVQKPLDRLSQNLVERRQMGHGINRSILVVIWVMLHYGLGKVIVTVK